MSQAHDFPPHPKLPRWMTWPNHTRPVLDPSWPREVPRRGHNSDHKPCLHCWLYRVLEFHRLVRLKTAEGIAKEANVATPSLYQWKTGRGFPRLTSAEKLSALVLPPLMTTAAATIWEANSCLIPIPPTEQQLWEDAPQIWTPLITDVERRLQRWFRYVEKRQERSR